MKQLINMVKCQKCSHEWVPRIRDVKVCPKCHSYNWNKKAK